jgi:hypothetical protein
MDRRGSKYDLDPSYRGRGGYGGLEGQLYVIVGIGAGRLATPGKGHVPETHCSRNDLLYFVLYNVYMESWTLTWTVQESHAQSRLNFPTFGNRHL